MATTAVAPARKLLPRIPFFACARACARVFLFKGAHEHPSMARYRNIFEARAADPNPETVSAPPTPTASESGAPAVQGLFCWVNARPGAGLRGAGRFLSALKGTGSGYLGLTKKGFLSNAGFGRSR
jgi:hypothetical protein